MRNEIKTFDDLLGKTIWGVVLDHDSAGEVCEIIFRFDDFSTLHLYDAEMGSGNDCEVRLIDVEGKISDLIGRPLRLAESVSQWSDESFPQDKSWNTWTFYRFATDKEFVTLRWGGRSNGYYSEEASSSLGHDPRLAKHPEYLEFAAKRQKEFLKNELQETGSITKQKKKI